MARFRRRPVEVDAEQWMPGRELVGVVKGPNGPVVQTPDGLKRVNRGDWVVTTADGKRYVCDPFVFSRTYERVG